MIPQRLVAAKCGMSGNASALSQIVFIIVDIFTQGPWSQFDGFEDPELRRLAQALPQTVLSSRADGTSRKYLYAFARWKEWAEGKSEITVFPAKDGEFAIYLQHLAETTSSKAAVETAINAVSWVHQLAGCKPIVDSPFVRAVRDGLARKLAKPVEKKEPITSDMLAAMARSSSDSLADLRLLAMAYLAFSAFLRCDELIKLRCCDMSFGAESMSISLPKSKTDQYRQGSSVLVARSATGTCPVAIVEKYLRKVELSCHGAEYVFRAIVHTKTGERLRRSGHLSYTRVRELMKEKLSSIGLDAAKFGMHSFRAGGATAAANAGVPDRLFKRHGRWRSESAKDGYIKDSVKARLRD